MYLSIDSARMDILGYLQREKIHSGIPVPEFHIIRWNDNPIAYYLVKTGLELLEIDLESGEYTYIESFSLSEEY